MKIGQDLAKKYYGEADSELNHRAYLNYRFIHLLHNNQLYESYTFQASFTIATYNLGRSKGRTCILSVNEEVNGQFIGAYLPYNHRTTSKYEQVNLYFGGMKIGAHNSLRPLITRYGVLEEKGSTNLFPTGDYPLDFGDDYITKDIDEALTEVSIRCMKYKGPMNLE